MLPRPISPTLSTCCITSNVSGNAIAFAVDAGHRARGIAHHQGVGRNILGHHAAGGNHGVLAHGDTADDGGIGADAGTVVDARRSDLPLGVEGTRHLVVGEAGVGADEHVIADLNSVVDGYAVLNLAAAADLHRMVDVDVLGEDAAFADHHILADLHIDPDLGAGNDAGLFGDVGRRVDVHVVSGHWRRPVQNQPPRPRAE